MSIILVTGVAGFIGMSVANALLQRGDTVIGIDNLNAYYTVELKRRRLDQLTQRDSGRFHFLQLDFADMAALASALAGRSFDAIVHLGAQAGVRHSINNPHLYVQSNVVGHLNILELARERAVRHLVYASSSSVYGSNTKTPFAVQDRVDHPVSLYAATKKSDELMSEAYAHLYRLPQTGLRFFTVYGPWGRPDMALWMFTENILAGRPINLYNHGEMKRDFTFIDDIVTGVVACLDHPPRDDGTIKTGGTTSPHDIYNIGNSRAERLLRLVEVLEEACGRKADCQMLPMQDGDVKETFADIGAISDRFGFVPATTIDVGVPKFVRWFKSYHHI